MAHYIMACGTEDFGINTSRQLSAYFRDLGLDITYEEGPGSHEWDFWNEYIHKVLDWLPLE